MFHILMRLHLQKNSKYLIFGTKIWDMLHNDVKETKTVVAFKGATKVGNWNIPHVDFLSVIWLKSGLSQTYLQRSIIASTQGFKVSLCVKKNIVYLFICFSIDTVGNLKTCKTSSSPEFTAMGQNEIVHWP